MTYSVCIIERQTGESRMYELGDHVRWNEGSEFWWVEGNFGCDCNRSMCWMWAADASNEEVRAAAHPCGRSRFFVPYALLADGTMVNLDAPEGKA